MPSTYQEHQQQAAALIRRARTVLIVTHAALDGDGLSSAIALHMVLSRMGKASTVICPGPVPEAYHFLPGVDRVRSDAQSLRDCVVSVDLSPGTEIDNVRYVIRDDRIDVVLSPKRGDIVPDAVSVRKSMEDIDLIVALDAPSKQSLGAVYQNNVDLFYAVPVINIDHHVENSYYGKVNVVDVSAASTTEILSELIPVLGAPEGTVDRDVATLLLAGLITDTMSFQNARTTPRALHVASSLLKLGARQQEIIRHLYKTKKLSTLHLWGRILGNVGHDHLRRVLWSSYSYRDLDEFGASEKEVNGIIDGLLCNAPGMEIVALLYEKAPSETHLAVKTLSEALDLERVTAAVAPGFVRQNGAFVSRRPLSEALPLLLEALFALQRQRLGLSAEQVAAVEQARLSAPTAAAPSPDPSLSPVRLSDLEGRISGEVS